MEIYVLRHCETEANKNNLWSGPKKDLLLSEKGEERNQELIKELSKIDFDVIYTSPMKRCLQTSEKIANIANTKLIIDNRLIERNFGKLEGKKCIEEDKRKLSDFNLNTDLSKDVEKIQDLYYKKVKPFYEDVLNKPHKKILIVTHSWIVRLSNYFFSNEKDTKLISIRPKNGEYIVFNKEKLVSRNFNEVFIDGDKIIKKSSYTNKFHDEINWMINIPDELKKFTPHIYEYHISPTNKNDDVSFIKMEYINEKSFDDFYINKKINLEQIQCFFNHIVCFLKTTSNYQIEMNPNDIQKYLYEIYYNKTIQRCDSIKNSHKFKYYFYNEFYINGIKYKSINYYLSFLEDKLNELKIINEFRPFRIIHGDLCFNNIIFKNNKMYLIDPRGSFGQRSLYGDYLYELAKILHSINGYDNIVNNHYELKLEGNSIKYKIHKSQNKENFLNGFHKFILERERERAANLFHRVTIVFIYDTTTWGKLWASNNYAIICYWKIKSIYKIKPKLNKVLVF